MNKHLYLCHPLVLSSPRLMMHGHTNLKYGVILWLLVTLVKENESTLALMLTKVTKELTT